MVVLPLPHTSDEPITTDTTSPQAYDHSLSPPTSSPSLVPAPNNPIPDHDPIVPPQSPITRRFDRIKQPNVKLQNFHLYHTALVDPSQSSSSSGFGAG
ncbi:hypothetical protein LWI29_019429 [Acer saccharum]|uniref:Uncharacterized protein n=1 Tax=Acer saccharum TaxID=4024 RepID=A0AA39TF75_ACESA|nr:hypothetical protein LWI29_019429 [Acer saccharum]